MLPLSPSESLEASPARISAAIASATCRSRSAGAAHRSCRSRSMAAARAHRLASRSLWRAITAATAAAAKTTVDATSAAGFLIGDVAFAPRPQVHSAAVNGAHCHGIGGCRPATLTGQTSQLSTGTIDSGRSATSPSSLLACLEAFYMFTIITLPLTLLLFL